MTLLMIATLWVHSSAPPLSPEDAARVLRASHSIADRTNARSYPDAPLVAVAHSSTTDGPFGPFPEVAPAPKPLSITFRASRRERRR